MSIEAELKLRMRLFNLVAKLQDIINAVDIENNGQVITTVQRADWHGPLLPYLTNTIVSAAIARPEHCEQYGEMIFVLWSYDVDFPESLRLSVLRSFDEAPVQFLTALLLKRNLISS
jgi:hypothetical protein